MKETAWLVQPRTHQRSPEHGHKALHCPKTEQNTMWEWPHLEVEGRHFEVDRFSRRRRAYMEAA